MVTLENQQGETVNVKIMTDNLPYTICGVTTTNDGVNFLITINKKYLDSKNGSRGRIALIHEFLHVYNWEAGHNKRRHRACHFLAVALFYGATCEVLKIRSKRAVSYISTIKTLADEWWSRYIKNKHDITQTV